MKIGVAMSGITTSDSSVPDIPTKFRMAKDSGVFDFVTRTPPDDEFGTLLAAAEQFGLPVLASTWYYTAGRDEPLFERNIVKARLLGTKIHDVQLATRHVDGHVLSDDEVADAYLRCHDFAARHDVEIAFEIHVNMWSEHFGRVARVARLVRARGIPFALTLDHSHVIFKIDNPEELRVQDLAADVTAGRVVLEPDRPGNVTQQWIDAGYVRHCHARAAAPANPRNIRARHPDGSFGRGIQYPFVAPGPGEWHAVWRREALEPWKQVIRNLLQWRARHPDSAFDSITCEFIPAIDYGAGAGYSIFEQNVACARWLRDEWQRASNS